jgi:hypothetical protein
MLPFTRDQFFAVFGEYNTAVWPAQVGLYFLALVAAGMVALGWRSSRPWVLGVLALLWLWAGIVYHLLFFTRINGAAWAFGLLFVLEGGLLAWYALSLRRIDLERPTRWQGWLGAALITYALVLYPLLGFAAGGGIRQLPVLGVPCPTAIFTFGLFFCLAPRLPRVLLAVPLFWAAVGGSAAFLLAVPQDLGLAAAGALGLLLLRRESRAAT